MPRCLQKRAVSDRLEPFGVVRAKLRICTPPRAAVRGIRHSESSRVTLFQMAKSMSENREGKELRDEYKRLMDAAAENPGVAEVLQVYGRLAPYAPPPVAAQPVTRYAAGGNA